MNNNKTGLKALLRPDDSILVLIDHQPFQFANLHSHEPTVIVNNVVALAKAAKVFDVPTILTAVIEERGGPRHGRAPHGPGWSGADHLNGRSLRMAA